MVVPVGPTCDDYAEKVSTINFSFVVRQTVSSRCAQKVMVLSTKSFLLTFTRLEVVETLVTVYRATAEALGKQLADHVSVEICIVNLLIYNSEKKNYFDFKKLLLLRS